MPATILVADDNLTVQRMASEMLTEEGMDVITVANGMAAIKKLPDVKPLVVVADVDMPGKNGYEVCDFVKSQPDLGYVRVLLVVSDSDPLDGSRGVEVRADGVVKKPFDRQSFVSIVMKSLGEAQALCPPPAAAPIQEPVQEQPAQIELQEQTSEEPQAAPPADEDRTLVLEIPSAKAAETQHEAQPSSDWSDWPEPPQTAQDAEPREHSLSVSSATMSEMEPLTAGHPQLDVALGEPEQHSSEPPIVDWPANFMAPLDSFAEAGETRAGDSAGNADFALLEPPLPDLVAPEHSMDSSDQVQTLQAEPAPLPDLQPMEDFELPSAEPNPMPASLDPEPGAGLAEAESKLDSPSLPAEANNSPKAEGELETSVLESAGVEIPKSEALVQEPLPSSLGERNETPSTPLSIPANPVITAGPVSFGQPTLPNSLESLPPAQPKDTLEPPPQSIDAFLVSSIIHAVVRRMAPPALPEDTLENLERQLAAEIMPDLLLKSPR